MASNTVRLAALASLALSGARLSGQEPPALASDFAVFGVNVVIGGVTAATRAIFEHKDAVHAFTGGAVGGGVHFAGKYLASRRGALSGISGLAIASLGSSLVANAGAGAPPLSDLYLPAGPLRFRFAVPQSRMRVGLNLFETGVIVRELSRDGLHVDWGRSAQTGTVVLNTDGRGLRLGDRFFSGVTVGPVIVLGPSAQIGTATWKHETTHLHQNWFMQETWDRPVEAALRRHVRLARVVPSWIEIGLLSPLFYEWQEQMWGTRMGVPNLMEGEAYVLQRQ